MKHRVVLSAFFTLIASIVISGCEREAVPPARANTESKAQSQKVDPYREAKKLYKVQIPSVELKVGQKGQAAFVIALKKGAKVHSKAPFRCKLSATSSVKLEKNRLGHSDKIVSKDKKRVIVPAPITAISKGEAKVNFDCSFYICTKDICARTVEKVAVPVKTM